MISYAFLVQTGHSYDFPPSSNDPSFESDYAPSPLSSSYQKHLEICAVNLFPSCGEDIFYSVFYGNRTLTSDCCDNLVNDVGKRCHNDLINNLLESPTFKTNRIQILHRSEEVWNDCLVLEFNSPQAQPDRDES